MYGMKVTFPTDYDHVKIIVTMRSLDENDFGAFDFDLKAARESVGILDENTGKDKFMLTGKVSLGYWYNGDFEANAAIITMELELFSPVRGTPLSDYVSSSMANVQITQYFEHIIEATAVIMADARAEIPIHAMQISPA